MWAYPIKLSADDNGTYLVTCKDFPEVTTFGENKGDAAANAIDAIEEAIAARMADKEDIPAPSKGRIRVSLPAQTVAKVLLYRAMLSDNISKNELARRLNCHRPQVDRLLNLRHGTRLDAMERAFFALGKSIQIGADDRTST